MKPPVKTYNEEEMSGMLERIYPDYMSGTPQKRKLITEMYWKTFGFKSPKQFESFFAKEDERSKEPVISSARGKAFVPIRPKLAKEFIETQKEIAPLGPSDRRRAAELQMEGLKDQASGEKKTFYDALTNVIDILESAAPGGGALNVVKGKTQRTKLRFGARRRARKMLEQQRKKQAKQAAKRLPKKNIGLMKEGSKQEVYDAPVPKEVLEPLFKTPVGMKLQNHSFMEKDFEVRPIEIIKAYYPRLRNLPDEQAANILTTRLNQYRKKKEKVAVEDLLNLTKIKFEKLDPGNMGYFIPGEGVAVSNLLNTEQKIATILHEITHRYTSKVIERKYRRREDTVNKMGAVKAATLAGNVPNPQNMAVAKKVLMDPLFEILMPINFSIDRSRYVQRMSELGKRSKTETLRMPETNRPEGKPLPEDIAYLYRRDEVGPNLFGFMRRFAATEANMEITTRKGLTAFIDKVNKNPVLKEKLFNIMNNQHGQGIEQSPEHNQNILDVLRKDKKVQLEFLKWAKGQEREGKAYV